MVLAIGDTYAGASAARPGQIEAAFARHGRAIPGLDRLIARHAPDFNFRTDGVGGQVSQETGWGTNWWTTAHSNILSIGVTGESTATPQSTPDWQPQETPRGRVWLRGYHFDSVEAGLIAGLIHMAYYVYGRDKARWPASAQRYHGRVDLNPRLPVLLTTAYPGTVARFADLGNGRFAADPRYGAGIVSRANTILGVPPAIVQRLGIPAVTRDFYAWLGQRGIRVIEDYVDDGWVGRGGMQPQAIVHHVTDGESVQGSIDWWRRAEVEGSTQQIVAGNLDPHYPEGTLAITRKDEDTAWANGALANPNVGLTTVASWRASGVNPNRVTLSREHSGKPFRAGVFGDKMMLTSLYADLHWIAKHPSIAPDRAHLLRHSDIDAVNRANCPGPQFPLDRLIADIVASVSSEDERRIETVLAFWRALREGEPLAEAWRDLRGK